MSNYSPTRDTLAKRIAGEIVLSPSPGKTMRKWRGLLGATQIEVAGILDLSPSVVSDYETGRRRSPGSGFIKRYVGALLDIDESKGGQYIRQLSRITLDPSDMFIDIREFMAPVSVEEIVETVEGTVYGTTSERALVFSGVSRGRSPMIAVKISPFKPRVIVLHGLEGELDPLAVQLATHEGIPLAVSGLETEDELVEVLVDLYESTG